MNFRNNCEINTRRKNGKHKVNNRIGLWNVINLLISQEPNGNDHEFKKKKKEKRKGPWN